MVTDDSCIRHSGPIRRVLYQNQGAAGWQDASGTALTQAGVLVALVARPLGIHLILTKRSSALRDHPGQISFPGGRIDDHDGSPEATARREAYEEVGLLGDSIETLGYLPSYRTGTGFIVFPTVACIHAAGPLKACPIEVAEIFEVPLAFVLDASNHRSHVIEKGGAHLRLGTLPYGPYFIWGATAGILLTLYHFLTGRRPRVDPQGEWLNAPRDHSL